MNKYVIAIVAAGLLAAGCSADGVAGAGAGLVGAGAGYELRARQQMTELEKDRNASRISNHDYETRKDQIEKGSIFY